MSRTDYAGAVNALVDAGSICVVTHVRPDADAIGSATALMLGLRQRGKEVRALIGQDREISGNLLSIPKSEEIELTQELPLGFDLYVTVDCGALDRTGYLAPGLGRAREEGRLLCIDHHASNEGFGSVNLVDVACESTTVVLIDVMDKMSLQVDRAIAHCLYAGLVTDTGSFRWGRPSMHTLAARLMHYGLDTKQIAVDLLDSTTVEDIQMLGRVFQSLSIEQAGAHSLGILVASLDDIGGHTDSAVESLVDFVRALEGTDMGVVFKEMAPHVWAVSLRSSTINCAEIALRMGGGGHLPAAGYTAHGTASEAVAQLVEVMS